MLYDFLRQNLPAEIQDFFIRLLQIFSRLIFFKKLADAVVHNAFTSNLRAFVPPYGQNERMAPVNLPLTGSIVFAIFFEASL